MPTKSKKRRPEDEPVAVDEDKDKLIAALKEQVKTLEAKLAEYEEYDDDDNDESVCDGSAWSVKYHLLKQYRARHGDCKVPQPDKDLGLWVKFQRQQYVNKKLTQERIDKLDKIGFYWGKGFPEPRTWDDGFRLLEEFHQNFGHVNVHVDPNPSLQNELAQWVKEQRKQGKRLEKSKPSTMTIEQYKKLAGLGFNFRHK